MNTETDDAGQGFLLDALGRVEANADVSWLDRAYQCGVRLSERQPSWSADDLWDMLETDYPDTTTHEPRAMGAVVVALKRDHQIAVEPLRYVKSNRAQSHKRPIPVHVSLVFEPAF